LATVHDIKRRLVLSPNDDEAPLQLAELFFGEGDLAGAIDVLERVLRRRTLLASERRLLAICHRRRGATHAARQLLEAAAKAAPTDAEVRDELCEMLFDEGRVDDALLHAEVALEHAPSATRLLRAAGLYRSVRLPHLAQRALVAAAALEPGSAPIAAALVEMEAELGIDRAEAVLASPELSAASGTAARGRDQLRAGQLDAAKRTLALGTEGERTSREFALLRAAVLLRLGRRDAALQLLDGPLARAVAASSFSAGAALPVGHLGVLGWHPSGGTVSPLQAVAVPGRGELHLTGNVGAQGLEAAKVAFSCLKARAADLHIESEVRVKDLHFHYVDTELAKDGGSAGLALVLAGMSAFRGKPLARELAATGEITLMGEVKAVAGIHEKLIAAHLARMRTVLVPRRNLKDTRELPPEVHARLRIVHVDTVSEAAAAALEP
jgi:ATP-dependent Lon protease